MNRNEFGIKTSEDCCLFPNNKMNTNETFRKKMVRDEKKK